MGSEQDLTIPVPSYIEPWTGRTISLERGSEVKFGFSPRAAAEPVLGGRVYRLVPVPRHLTKSGKARNQFSPNKDVESNPQLLRALAVVCPAHPTEFLSYLLAAGAETFEFDAINQARIGGSPSWVQDAEFPVCEHCKKRMNMVLQLPGTMLQGRPIPRGTFYFFACVKHPDEAKTVAQFT